MHLPAFLAFLTTCGNQSKFQIPHINDKMTLIFPKPIDSLMTLCSGNSYNPTCAVMKDGRYKSQVCPPHRLPKPCYSKTQFDL